MTRAVRWRSRSWRYCIVIAGLATLLAALAASPASASDGGGGPVTCGPGTSCYIQITQWVHFSGDHSPGTTNVVVDIQPPACSWDPVGNAQTGSQYIVSQYAGGPPSPSDPYDQSATYQQAKEMLATGSTEAGEWYFLPDAPYDTAAQAQECAAQPLYFFAQHLATEVRPRVDNDHFAIILKHNGGAQPIIAWISRSAIFAVACDNRYALRGSGA